MNEIVFLTPNTEEPFTTSDVIAECTGIESRKIKVTIRKYENEFKQFGKIEIVSAPYQAESPKIGRPSEAYKLNEQQATFLMTLLKNTPVVVQFKQSDRWFLYTRYEGCGYTSSKTTNFVRKNGSLGCATNMYWTQKGRLFLYDSLKSDAILPMIEREIA